MRLAVVSHKVCWNVPGTPDGYQTDGGFPLQIKAISELFDETKVVVPCEPLQKQNGVSPLEGHNLRVRQLSVPKSVGWRRKLQIPFWLLRNGAIIWREVRRADAVHAPVPGDVGTIGMIFALMLRKPLFVRHCGNWMVQRTAAEQFWKWMMEKFAGGRNVMLATGGDDRAPSAKNANIEWIFSTSLSQTEIANAAPRNFPSDGKLKLFTASRLETRKGTDVVIESLPLILKSFPQATLDIAGDGSQLEKLKMQAEKLKVKDRVTFHGKVEPKRVVELMKQSHVFCYPTSASEGFPKVVLEALACGLPVITTHVSVLPRLIGADCGVLLDEPTGGNLAKAIEGIFADGEKYNRLSAQAVATAQNYSLEKWRNQIGETLRKSWNVPSLSSIS